MSLLGQAAVAMWWNIHPERREEFCDWHSHEHFPERMSIPGFYRGSRWAGTEDEGSFFVMYELDDYATLTSSEYLSRLNSPTPWSSKMMPHHLDMVRSQCRIAESFGGGVANLMTTIRFSPIRESRDRARASISKLLIDLPNKPGLTGAHLLITDTPASVAQTTEQKIRGTDGVADWIILLSGYAATAIEDVCKTVSSDELLAAAGAGRGVTKVGRYRLSFAMASIDIH